MDFQVVIWATVVEVTILSVMLYLWKKYQKRKQQEKIVSVRFKEPSPSIPDSEGKHLLQFISRVSASPRGEYILEGLARKEAMKGLTLDLAKGTEQQILASAWSTTPDASQEQIKGVVEEQVTELGERITELEDQTASIQLVLLDERIKQLTKQVDSLANKRLSRWDVAIVVGAMIGGIILIVGATYKVLMATGAILPPIP